MYIVKWCSQPQCAWMQSTSQKILSLTSAFSSKAWHVQSSICHRVHYVLASEHWHCCIEDFYPLIFIEVQFLFVMRIHRCCDCAGKHRNTFEWSASLSDRNKCLHTFLLVFFHRILATKVYLDEPCLDCLAAILLAAILLMRVAWVSFDVVYTVGLANGLTKVYIHLYCSVAPCCIIGHLRWNRVFCRHAVNGCCITACSCRGIHLLFLHLWEPVIVACAFPVLFLRFSSYTMNCALQCSLKCATGAFLLS